MTDNQLIALLATQMEAAAASGGWLYKGNPYVVLQKNQPTQEGMPYGPAIYFEKLFDDRYGFPMVDEQLNPDGHAYTDTETQLTNTTFQVSAMVIQDPSDLSIPTASDVVGHMARYLQSRACLSAFLAQGVSMFRITQVRNPYFEDDRHRNEASPNFDIILTHSQSIVTSTPAVEHHNFDGVVPVLP